MEVKRRGIKLNIKQEIRKAMKGLQNIPEVDGLSYEDLYFHPNLDHPEGLKVQKFDTSGGTRYLLAHLRA